MKESEILGQYWKRKKTNIPFPDWPIKVWLFFKTYLVEDSNIRSWMEKRPFQNYVEFRNFITPIVVSNGPRGTRGNVKFSAPDRSELITICWFYYNLLLEPTLPFRVKESAVGGVGLFWKQSGELILDEKLVTPTALSSLVGFLIEVPDDIFSELQLLNYPSLYGENFILIGPLSLINHQCKALFGFSSPLQKSDFVLFLNIPVVKLRLISEAHEVVEGTEIFAQYSHEKPAWCKC